MSKKKKIEQDEIKQLNESLCISDDWLCLNRKRDGISANPAQNQPKPSLNMGLLSYGNQLLVSHLESHQKNFQRMRDSQRKQ